MNDYKLTLNEYVNLAINNLIIFLLYYIVIDIYFILFFSLYVAKICSK